MAAHGPKRRWLGIVVTTAAILAAIAHMIWPNLKVDAITIVLVAIATLPWLGDILESVELPGGWKVKFQSLEARQKLLERDTADAKSTAQVALGAAQTGDLSGTPATMDAVRRLVEEYERLRSNPRPNRTVELDRLFGAMVRVVPGVPDFDLASALVDRDGGVRLTGYACLYGKPDPTRLGEVVEALTREPVAFNQYWAIRTVGVLIDHADRSTVPDSIFDRLHVVLDDLPPGSTRHAQLTELIRTRR